MKQLPLFYFTPTIFCIDDDLSVTAALGDLISKFYEYKSFNNTDELLQYLEKYSSLFLDNKLLRSFSESEYSDSPGTALVELNLNNISSFMRTKGIHKEIAVIIVDYLMPDFDGLSLCKTLKDYPFKKLLLTGSDDYKAGISAVNAGILDRFISKSTPPEELLGGIEELVFLFFLEHTDSLLQFLEADHKLPLSDKLFVNYFMKLFKDNNVKEYYLADKNGSLIMLDKNNKKSILIVHTNKSLDDFLKLIEGDKDYKVIYDQVKLRQKIPYLDNKVSFSEASILTSRLYSPKMLMGRENYYIYHLALA